MRANLFRDEVLQAQSPQWLGTIRIARAPALLWVTGLSALLVLLLVSYAITGQIQRRTRLSGVLLPEGGLVSVTAPQMAVVAELLVHEGEEVQAGQALLKIRAERHVAQGEMALLNAQNLAQRRQSLSTERLLIQQQARQRADSLSERLRSLQSDERQMLSELDATRLRASLAQKSMDRFVELARSGYVSAAQVQQKQEELLDLDVRERNAERNLTAVRRDIQSVRADADANETTLKTSLTQVERNLASLEQEGHENEARSALQVVAPQAGRVASLGLYIGQTLQAGQTLLTLMPKTPGSNTSQQLEAQLYAPSRTMGFVQPGQQVWLRYAAYPYQQFGMGRGEVLAVSQAPLSASDLPSGPTSNGEPMYRIRVRLQRQDIVAYGKQLQLKPGMALDADVLQRRMKVWQWILEPLLTVSGVADRWQEMPASEPIADSAKGRP